MIKEWILVSAFALALPHAFANPAPVDTAADTPTSAEAPAASAEPSAEQAAEAFLASLNFRHGEITLGDGLATLKLPENFVFLDGKDAERVLVEAWGNPKDEQLPLGMLLPADVSPLEAGSWAVTIEYDPSGYVSDEDAADIDYDEMLADMKSDSQQENQWRRDNGYPTVELLGWAARPHYDAQGKKLHWAKELHFADAPSNTLNYNIRVLGRKGVLVLNFIAGMEQLPQIEQQVPAVLAMTEFNQGNRYAEFNPDIDEVAAYGLGALIAGKVAAKAGLLAAALLLLKKFWVVLMLPVLWLWRRITGAKPAAEAVAAPVVEVVPEAPQLPVKSVMDMNKPGQSG